jgi:hypothetical protein
MLRSGAVATPRTSRHPLILRHREEFDAIGLLDTMPQRPSVADFHRFNRELREAPVKLRARVAVWNEKRREQRSWFTRTGADTVERRHRRLLAQKTVIEHQLMELMTDPVGGFAVGEPAFNS